MKMGLRTGIDIFYDVAYNNNIKQATTCVCQNADVRECAGMHCLTEFARGVVQ